MKISIVVPVYKKPKFLIDIVNKILNDLYLNKEIIVVIDGDLTEEIKKEVETIEDNVTIVYPKIHLGKAEALNRAVKELDTDVLLFLDNDILLPNNVNYLTILSEKIKDSDIVEMPKKVISESIYSEMISYEYQSIAILCSIFSKILKKSPGVIGAAFAIKKELFNKLDGFRKVVHEDGDFGARAFRLHAKYIYELKLAVMTSMPNNLRDWIIQRKRWSLINILWFKDNFIYLLKNIYRQPRFIVVLILLVIPTVLSFLLFVLLNHINLSILLPLILLIEQPFQFFAGILLWFAHHELITNGLISIISSFFITMLVYMLFSYFNNFKFNIFSFSFFYFIYLPVLVVINILMFIIQIKEKSIKLDWKV